MPFGVGVPSLGGLGGVANDPSVDPVQVDRGELFQRAYRVVLGVPGQPFAWDLSALDVEFRCNRNLKPEPNTVELKIYNLGPDLRAAFNSAKKNQLLLQAGYKGTGISTLFQGEVRSGWSTHDGPDWVTTVRAGDGEKEIKVRINVSFGPQVLAQDAIRVIAKKMGLKPGNIDAATKNLNLSGIAEIFPQGVAVSGNSWRELQWIARSAGLEVSIQGGALQLLELHQPLSELAILIDSDSGMIASPEVNADGRVTVNTLMIPEVKPGAKVEIRSSQVRGFYRIEEVETVGQIRGEDWGHRLTVRRFPT
jgi:hypothetical protein